MPDFEKKYETRYSKRDRVRRAQTKKPDRLERAEQIGEFDRLCRLAEKFALAHDLGKATTTLLKAVKKSPTQWPGCIGAVAF
jgi:hypothetical protein